MWQLVLHLLTIGMFGVGIGMLYTPILGLGLIALVGLVVH